MKRYFIFLFLCIYCVFSYAEKIEEDLAKELNKVASFSSQFEQTVSDGEGRILQTLQGEIQFQRPLLFYWKVKSSDSQIMWVRNHEIIIYDSRLKQATIRKISSFNDPSLLPLMLLAGDTKEVLRHFLVKKDQGLYKLKPIDKSTHQLLTGVILELGKNGFIQSISYETNLGQMTKIVFTKANVNGSLNQTLFFQPLPLGTDIIQVD